MAGEGHPGIDAVEKVLLEYASEPGRFGPDSLQLRTLSASTDEVIQLAIGRSGRAASTAAARVFVRRALLASGAGPSGVLGLGAGASEADIKKRYRLLMRLLHPDFAGSDTHWPQDAAVRVNLAYEQLLAPKDRPAAPNRPPRPVVRTARRPAMQRPAARARGPSRATIRWAIVSSFGIAMLLLTALLLTNTAPSDELVQRERVTTSLTVQAAPAAVAKVVQNLSSLLTPEPRAPQPQETVRETFVAATGTPPDTEPAIAMNAATTPATAAPMLVAAAPEAVRVPQPVPEPMASRVAQAEPAVRAQPAPPAAAAAPASPPPQTVPDAPALTVADAHPILAMWLQQLESGDRERALQSLDPVARDSASARAFAQQFAQITGGQRAKIEGVEFHGEPRPGGVRVLGTIKLRTGTASAARDLKVQLDFARRGSSVAMVNLSVVP